MLWLSANADLFICDFFLINLFYLFLYTYINGWRWVVYFGHNVYGIPILYFCFMMATRSWSRPTACHTVELISIVHFSKWWSEILSPYPDKISCELNLFNFHLMNQSHGFCELNVQWMAFIFLIQFGFFL